MTITGRGTASLAIRCQEVPSRVPTNLWFPLPRDQPDRYRYVVSKSLGRGSYKEQYLFVYRYRPRLSKPKNTNTET